MENKRGVIGSFVVTFVATVIVVIILLVYLLFADIFMEAFDDSAGNVILKEDSLGVSDGIGYMENYVKLAEARTIVSRNIDLDYALKEVSYEE